MNTIQLVLGALKIVTIVLGAVIIYLGMRAFRASNRKPLLWLTVGMAVMTLGAIAEGAATLGGLDLDTAHVIEGVVTMLGFGILVYSLYA